MRKVRIAVIGLGRLGEKHLQALQREEKAEVVAICDVEPKILERLNRETNLPTYTDYRPLLKHRLEAVTIATPTVTHHEIARYFLSNGIHVFVEKPITATLKQANELISLAKKHKLILQVGHIERFNPAFSAVQKIIASPRFIECHRLNPFPNRSLDIGVVLDLMIHDIDIVLGLVNSPVKKIEAIGVAVLTAHEDIANARLTFKNNCIANLTVSRVADEPLRKIRIFQDNAYISLDYLNANAYLYRKENTKITKEAIPITKGESLQKEVNAFLECVQENKPPLVSGEVAKEALSVALKIQNLIWKKKKS